MKNRFVYLSFLLTLCSCNIDNSVIESSTIKESDTMSDYKNEEIESLKVLCIGNSFSVDTIEHVPNIALHSNVKNVKFGNLFITLYNAVSIICFLPDARKLTAKLSSDDFLSSP